MGVAYYGLSNTTGTLQGTTVNTTSLAGTWSTTDPIATAAELFDTSSGNGAGEFGAQLNSVLVNVTLGGQTSFGPNGNTPVNGCGGVGPTAPCPNEFWLQNYIEYTESTHVLQIGDEIWNFSNPTADWASSQSSGTRTIVGFGTVQEGELYALSGSGYALSVTIAPPFSLALYINYTQGPCHTDAVAGTGVPSCGSGATAVSTTDPVNELFMNYTIRNSVGAPVCPASEPTGRVCGEYDDVFFNSVGASNPTGVPATGPCPIPGPSCVGRAGSATIQANGTAYDPVGLTNDFEMDYGIGSDDGATNNIVYQNGEVGINYCQNANAVENTYGAIKCSSYSAPPAAVDFGGETGETSTGEVAYWTPQGNLAPGVPGPATTVAHLVTGPSLLLGLWNMTGFPYPSGAGGEPLSYQNIAPANAWIGIAAGSGVTSQSRFQVAPTFGWYSYWKGSGGATTPTTLGSDLYLPSGEYTLEVLLSGYTPYIGNVDLTTSGQAPTISLVSNQSTGVYTPLWAFSNSDLGNISINHGTFGLGNIGNQYELESAPPTVGAPFGTPGSLSWLFSNLNDYLFTVWIGEFINSTTAYAQSNPAPSFVMDYPSWQLPSLNLFGVPTTDQFQFYFYHVQNFTLAGGSHIYAWANSEATSLYSVICNTCKNVLIADNAFAVSDEGIQFTGGGATTASLAGSALPNTRNVVWGNNFTADSQLGFAGLDSPTQFVAFSTDAYDRVYNNAFGNLTVGRPSLISGMTTANTEWLNATCQPGYSPLGASMYPSATPCEPLSYSQSLNGFTLSGSIISSSYQGGNYWITYGNAVNPYATIPFLARTTSLTSGGISDTNVGARGDYAPLISYEVYDPNFAETGIPTSGSGTTSATAFQVRVANSADYVWLNETQTAAPTALCSGNPCVVFYLPSGTYTYTGVSGLTGALASAANPATGSFAISGAAVGLVTTFAFFPAFAVTFTESGLPGGTQWSVGIGGEPTLSSTTSTIVFSLPNGGYTYTVGSVAGYLTTNPTGTVTVSGGPAAVSVPFYPVLTSPSAPTVSATALDVDQALTVTGTVPSTGVPTYAWQWLVSVDGGAYAAATQCAVDSGTGAAAGATETCVIATYTLVVGDTYAFELQVTDSQSESQTSAASPTVTVASALTAAAAPTVSATAIDADQALTVKGILPSTGSPSYSWTWWVSENGGSYTTTSECAVNSGTGGSAGATVMCSIASNGLSSGSTYAFELQVTDSATAPETQTSAASPTVTVSSSLTAAGAPSVSATSLDVDQTLTVTGTIPSSGTAPYSWTWLVSANGGSYGTATQCAVESGSGAAPGATVTCSISGGSLVAGDSYTFELQVTDSTSETQTSAASPVVNVASALTASAAPSVSATALDVDQALTVTGSVPSTGTAPYSWTFLVSVNGGAYGPAAQCATSGGTGAAAGTIEMCSIAANTLVAGDTYSFELTVTDGATVSETQTSSASTTVAVSSALKAPSAPGVNRPALDVNQALTVTGTVPSTGSAPYSWEWLISANSGSFVLATQCTADTGTGAPAGATVICTIPSGTLTVGSYYNFELQVSDGASAPETQTSASSLQTVTVASALTTPATPSVSATALDVDQALTVAGTIPTTGTAPYSWTWMISVNGAAYVAATLCGVNGGTGAAGGASVTCAITGGTLTVGDHYNFKLAVSDSAHAVESKTSSASAKVTVKSALTAPAAPNVSHTRLVVSQLLTVTGRISSSGTSKYSWQWWVSVNGGAYVLATQCAVNSGSGASSGTVTCTIAGGTLTVGDTYNFELRVTDSATAPETEVSAPSRTVTVVA
jgi:hypothetical protein